MKNLIYSLALILASAGFTYSQCGLSYTPNDTTICPGDSVWASAFIPANGGPQSFDFDAGSLPPGWQTTGGQAFSTPCGPSPNGTPYYWASTAGSGTPQIGTPSFNVACGGTITFDMVFSVQGGPSPCEGPDLSQEGVELQYSLDGGLTWIPIIYYSPSGLTFPQNPGGGGAGGSGATTFTTWDSYSVPIPPGASTTGTMFRWVQEFSSGTPNDNWGLDNISILPLACAAVDYVNWSNGLNDTLGFWLEPVSDTILIAYSYDSLGVLLCTSDTIFISLHTNSLTYDLVDTLYAYCLTDSLDAEVMNFSDAIGPWSVDWSNGDTTYLTTFGTDGVMQDLILYTVDITDGCGFVYPDSVWMDVNQTLVIDTTIAYNASSCLPDGTAYADPDGETGVAFYNWSGPGTGANPIVDWDGTTTDPICPVGWYYFTVTDDVCQANDSVYIDLDNPPVVDITPTMSEQCAPLSVSFNSNQENIVNYNWDFGDGNTSNGENPTHTFTTSATVTLIGLDANGCADTSYAQVAVQPCGCTDPIGLNYNPIATTDDGSCIYPMPTVIAPNIFTPNGDDINDVYYLEVTNAANVDLIILNRWGDVLFDESGLHPAWDGTTPNGNMAPEGTYFYKYVVQGVSDEVEPLEGHGFIQLVNE